MKRIKVVAAIIEKDGKVFATQRGYGEFKDGWEFPGGKVESGEKPKDALIREIKEELETLIGIDSYIGTVEYDYPTFHLSMRCYICHIIAGNLHLVEHEASAWVPIDELDRVNWLPADRILLPVIQKRLTKNNGGLQ